MKRIKILLAFLIVTAGAKAQFNNTDNIRTYIDQYIRSNPTNAFQNNRLNTALKGLANLIDTTRAYSQGGARVVDTVYKMNDSTIAYRIKGQTYEVGIHGGGGVNLDSILHVRRHLHAVDSITIQLEHDTLAASLGGRRHFYGIDSNQYSGFLLIQEYQILRSIQALRTIPGGDTIPIWRTNINGVISDWIYDKNDVTSADDGFMLIVNNGRRFKRYVEDKINAKYFNARGDGITDDYAALQAGIDWIVKHDDSPTRTLFIPHGAYKITQPLIIYKWNSVTNAYEFCHINIEGESYTYFTGTQWTTQIKPIFNDKFAIGVELGKNCRIAGLYISGVADGALPYGNYFDFVKAPYSGYMAGLCRENPVSPYAGVVIDPFPITPDSTSYSLLYPVNRYPGMSMWYRGQGGTSGSSAITVEDCKIYGFTVCIGLSINGWTFNGESCNFNRIAVGWTKTALAVGHDQLKDNHVRDMIAWEFVNTMFDNGYGRGYGNIPFVDHVDIAGYVRKLVNFNDAGRYGLHFTRIFAENLFEIGNIRSPQTSTIENSDFDFATVANIGIPSPDTYLSGQNVLFKGVSMRIFDNSRKRLFFNGDNDNVNFENCTFQNLPVTRLTNVTGTQKVTFEKCKLSLAGYIAGPSSFLTQFGHSDDVILGSNYTIRDLQYSYGTIDRIYTDPVPEGILPEYTHTITVDTTNFTATFTESDTSGFWFKALKKDEYLFTSDNRYCARIDSVNKNTGYVHLSETPYSMRTGSYYLFLNYVRPAGTPFVGNVTSGSKKITAVGAYSDSYPYIGTRIESNSFPNGAYIDSVDAISKTVTMSMAATNTKAGCEFAMGNPQTVVYSTVAPSFLNVFVLSNTLWITKADNPGITKDRRYIFTKGGYTAAVGSQIQAEWFIQTEISNPLADSLIYFDQFLGAYKKIITQKTLNDTAAAIRAAFPTGGGGGATPTLQAVTTAGYTTNVGISTTNGAAAYYTNPTGGTTFNLYAGTGGIGNITNSTSGGGGFFSDAPWKISAPNLYPGTATTYYFNNTTATTSNYIMQVLKNGVSAFNVYETREIHIPTMSSGGTGPDWMAAFDNTGVIKKLPLPTAVDSSKWQWSGANIWTKSTGSVGINTNNFSSTIGTDIFRIRQGSSGPSFGHGYGGGNPYFYADDGSGCIEYMGSVSNNHGYFGTYSNHPVHLVSSGVNRLTVETDGTLTFPAHHVYVAGDSLKVPDKKYVDFRGGGSLHLVNDANYTITDDVGSVIIVNQTSAHTLTIPAAASYTNRIIHIRNGNYAFNLNFSLTVKEDNGVSYSAIGQNFSITIQSDGTDWWVIAKGT